MAVDGEHKIAHKSGAMSRTLFATPLYETHLSVEAGYPALNVDLGDAIRMLAAQDKAGQRWCKANGYGGYTSYASLNDLPLRATAFADLKRKLDRHASAFAKTLHFDLQGKRLALDDLWVNLLKPGAAHSGHIHPLSVLSGTLYVETPPGAGVIRFEDPRLPLMMAAPPTATDAPEAHRRFVSVAPAPGLLLMWESWLRHEVTPNTAKTPRLSISFNYRWG